MHVSLESTLLAWASFEALSGRLQIGFRNGDRYLYLRVPPACYQQLMDADSKGEYFNHHIRNCFPYQNLSRPSAPLVLAAPRKTK